MTDPRTYAVFELRNGWIELISAKNFPSETAEHLRRTGIPVNGDTHIAKFYRANTMSESGKLENTMPGSTFTHYAFERHSFATGGCEVVVIVGWYWTEKG